MEILNIRKTIVGYLINGYIECVEGDNNYQDVLKWIDDKKEIMPLYTKDESIEIKIQNIKNNFIKDEPLLITVTLFDGTKKDITFNTASISAIAIETSVKLSQDLNEASTKIWDVNNVVYKFDFNEANRIKNLIAKAYRDRILERQRLISEVI